MMVKFRSQGNNLVYMGLKLTPDRYPLITSMTCQPLSQDNPWILLSSSLKPT